MLFHDKVDVLQMDSIAYKYLTKKIRIKIPGIVRNFIATENHGLLMFLKHENKPLTCGYPRKDDYMLHFSFLLSHVLCPP